MGKRKIDWQDRKYVLGCFDGNVTRAKKAYFEFVKNGVDQGKRADLIGGGLIRSLGGWIEVKKEHLDNADRIKSDERILGDSEFVTVVFEKEDEQFEKRYRLKILGYDSERVEKEVLKLFQIEKGELYSGSRKKPISEARSVYCYWCVRELGETMTKVALRLGLSQPAVGYAVDRGERITKEKKLKLDK
jgi:hypothetical protein